MRPLRHTPLRHIIVGVRIKVQTNTIKYNLLKSVQRDSIYPFAPVHHLVVAMTCCLDAQIVLACGNRKTEVRTWLSQTVAGKMLFKNNTHLYRFSLTRQSYPHILTLLPIARTAPHRTAPHQVSNRKSYRGPSWVQYPTFISITNYWTCPVWCTDTRGIGLNVHLKDRLLSPLILSAQCWEPS